MHFPQPLMQGRLVRRYKRFLADVDFGGETQTVHCPNPGSMLGLVDEGATVFVSRSGNQKRKLPLTLEIVVADGVPVGINTGHPNRLAEEAIHSHLVPELNGYDSLRREVRYGDNSRIDIFLQKSGGEDCYVEIKNVTLSRATGLMEFPDCRTKRGVKHLAELARQAEIGRRAVMLFVVQRNDGERFRLARDLDPEYGRAFDDARRRGVEMLAWSCRVSETEIALQGPMPIDE